MKDNFYYFFKVMIFQKNPFPMIDFLTSDLCKGGMVFAGE